MGSIRNLVKGRLVTAAALLFITQLSTGLTAHAATGHGSGDIVLSRAA